MFMCFDTETDTLPIKIKKNNQVIDDFSNVNLQQISYILFDSNDINIVIKKYSSYVNYLSPLDILHFKENPITHITLEQLQSGKPITEILDDFYNDIKDVNIIIAHNAHFDVSLMKSLAIRNRHFKLVNILKNILVFDTMKISGSQGLNIINRPYIKLEELYDKIKTINNDTSITSTITKHEALDDTLHCYYCFKYLLKHLGYCRLLYNNQMKYYKDIYDSHDINFIKSCELYNQFNIKKVFIMYCSLKTGIYDNSFIDYIGVE